MPKTIVSNTMECSGNGRSLLKDKAIGNPWTIGGVGNAVWGGVWLRDILNTARLKKNAGHIAFEGFDAALGRSGIKFIRSIPLEKAMASTLLVYEMNGEPVPIKHGYPLRVLALGWTGANCVKWLKTITVLENPYEGFFMDKVYRVYQKGEDPKSGAVVTGLTLNPESICLVFLANLNILRKSARDAIQGKPSKETLEAPGTEKTEGHLVITTAVSDGKGAVDVVVGDNGCGIPDADIGKVFDPFYTNTNCLNLKYQAPNCKLQYSMTET